MSMHPRPTNVYGDQRPMAKTPLSFLPSPILRSLYRWGPASLVSRLTLANESLRTPRPVVLVRVDDFPRWDYGLEAFEEFHSIMEDSGVPYILGVIPDCQLEPSKPRMMSPEEVDCLRTVVRERKLELALHGFVHSRGVYRGLTSEIALYSDAELRDRVEAAESWFRDADLPFPDVFIPPFNTLTPANFKVLSEHFRIVMTGSSALTTFGKFAPQKSEKTIYLPSYGRLYGISKDVIRVLEWLDGRNVISAVALHWAWEKADGFSGLRSLLERLCRSFEVWTAKRLLEEFSLR